MYYKSEGILTVKICGMTVSTQNPAKESIPDNTHLEYQIDFADFETPMGNIL